MRKPSDGRFEEVALAIDQIRSRACSGAQHVLDVCGKLGFRLAVRVRSNFLVKQFSVLPYYQELKPGGFERIVAFRPETFQNVGLGNRSQRPAHRVLPVGGRLIGVTGRTLIAADIFHVRTNVAIGRGKGQSRVF